MRVIVLDGNENQAVACVRSLARAGHNVVVGASTSWSKAGWSRSCCATFRYPAPEENIDEFITSVVSEAGREPGTLVLPMTERCTLPLSASREKLGTAGVRLVLPSHTTILQAFDKHYTTRLAESLGIAVPKSALASSLTQAHNVAHSIKYPVVLKPRTSEVTSASRRVMTTGRPLYARNDDDLQSAYNELAKRTPHVLVQQYVEGTGTGYFALMRNGELRAEFAHRRIRDVRPTGSGSSLRTSVAVDPRLRNAGLSILKALGWHGAAMVEFRMLPDGTPIFMEVNGRFWASLSLAVYAGMDFPALVAEMAEKGDVKVPKGYRVGVRCRWLLGDLRHLIEVCKGAPQNFPGKFPSRVRTLLAFLRPAPGTFHDNFQWHDPLPEVGDWLDFSLRRMPLMVSRRSTNQEDGDAQRRYSHS